MGLLGTLFVMAASWPVMFVVGWSARGAMERGMTMRLRETLSGVAMDLSRSNIPAAYQAYIDINEVWLDVYGEEIVRRVEETM